MLCSYNAREDVKREIGRSIDDPTSGGILNLIQAPFIYRFEIFSIASKFGHTVTFHSIDVIEGVIEGEKSTFERRTFEGDVLH
tara:strand:- start:614 stop:862 length:249 start_codon:yes stop_codon:yes gene_type:complete